MTLENVKSDSRFEMRVTRVTVVPHGEPIFSELATTIEIDDEADGEFVKVTQHGGRTEMQKWVLLNKDEWPTVRDAIDMMISLCREGDCGKAD